jgi:hypothetical protein
MPEMYGLPAPGSGPSVKEGKQVSEKKPAAALSETEDAAQDAIDAMKSGDAKAFDLALKRHYELCAASKEDD